MIFELVGGPRDGEWIDTQGVRSWDVKKEFPTWEGSPSPGKSDGGKYARTNRRNGNRIVFEYVAEEKG